MRGFTERRAEQAMEMKGREAGFAGGGIQKNLRLVTGSQKIAGTAQTTKCFVIHQRYTWMRPWHGVIVLNEDHRKKATGKLRKKLCHFPASLCHDAPHFHLICIRGHT